MMNRQTSIYHHSEIHSHQGLSSQIRLKTLWSSLEHSDFPFFFLKLSRFVDWAQFVPSGHDQNSGYMKCWEGVPKICRMDMDISGVHWCLGALRWTMEVLGVGWIRVSSRLEWVLFIKWLRKEVSLLLGGRKEILLALGLTGGFIWPWIWTLGSFWMSRRWFFDNFVKRF